MRRTAVTGSVTLGVLLTTALLAPSHIALGDPVAVLTRSYDNARTGANTRESTLTPDVVRHGLHRLFQAAVEDDKRLEAQPLIIPKVRIASDGNNEHDLLLLCSMANTVWAFDANTGTRLWKLALPEKPIKGGQNIDLYKINDQWGILSTPVVDGNTLYLLNWSSPDGSIEKSKHRLHRIDLTTGAEIQPAITLQASPAGGDPFVSAKQKQRSALLLAGVPDGAGNKRKTIFAAFAMTHEDDPTSHGWVFAFDVDTFRQTAAFCTTPKHGGGGIWQAGQGPSADDDGSVYVMTGNGAWDGKEDFSESFLKLRYAPPTGPQDSADLTRVSWFTPFRDTDRHNPTGGNYDFKDQDLGSGGPVVVRDQSAVIGAGKDGVLFVLPLGHLGDTTKQQLDDWKQFAALKQSPPPFLTYFPGMVDVTDRDAFHATLDSNFQGKTHHLHGSPVVWRGPDHGTMLFCWGENGRARAWNFDAQGKVVFLAEGAEEASAGSGGLGGMPGGMLTLSANGDAPHTAVLWGTVPLKGLSNGQDNNGDANKHVVDGILYAYDATSFEDVQGGGKRLRRLWDSKQEGGEAFLFNKFCPPVVANGKVYVTTYNGRVDVYGP